MNKLALSIATAASAATISFATPSRADETTTTTTTNPPTQTQPAPAQQPTTQSVTVQAPPAQPAPASQTTTTAAPYAPPPQGQEMYAERSTEHRPNRTLLSTGVGMFVVSYGASVVVGAVSNRDEDKNLYIPLVGPWMDLNDRSNSNIGGNENVNKAMLITSGIVQGAGVLLGIGSLIIPETSSTTEKREVAKPSVHVTPVSFGAGAGVGAVGRF